MDIRFDKLHKLKLNNWIEEKEAVNVGTKQPLTRGSKKSKKNQKPAQSSLRALIIGMVIVILVYLLSLPLSHLGKSKMEFYPLFLLNLGSSLNEFSEKINNYEQYAVKWWGKRFMVTVQVPVKGNCDEFESVSQQHVLYVVG